MTTPAQQPAQGPVEVSQLHRQSDVNSGPLAQHHTLGVSPNQASPGNHSHDGKDSVQLASHPHPYYATGSKVADSELLDGVDGGEWLRKGYDGGSAGGGARNTRQTSNLNQNLVSGWYDGSAMTGAPDSSWWLVEVLSHSNGSHWQRQIAYSMTGEQGTQTAYSRRCNGGDPTNGANWTYWQKFSGGGLLTEVSAGTADFNAVGIINPVANLTANIVNGQRYRLELHWWANDAYNNSGGSTYVISFMNHAGAAVTWDNASGGNTISEGFWLHSINAQYMGQSHVAHFVAAATGVVTVGFSFNCSGSNRINFGSRRLYLYIV